MSQLPDDLSKQPGFAPFHRLRCEECRGLFGDTGSVLRIHPDENTNTSEGLRVLIKVAEHFKIEQKHLERDEKPLSELIHDLLHAVRSIEIDSNQVQRMGTTLNKATDRFSWLQIQLTHLEGKGANPEENAEIETARDFATNATVILEKFREHVKTVRRSV